MEFEEMPPIKWENVLKVSIICRKVTKKYTHDYITIPKELMLRYDLKHKDRVMIAFVKKISDTEPEEVESNT